MKNYKRILPTAWSVLVIKYNRFITIFLLLGGDIKSKKEKPESGNTFCYVPLRRPVSCACEFVTFDRTA